jgi:hypothetical protein
MVKREYFAPRHICEDTKMMRYDVVLLRCGAIVESGFRASTDKFRRAISKMKKMNSTLSITEREAGHVYSIMGYPVDSLTGMRI